MRTRHNTIQGQSFRIDPLSKDRLHWIKSFCEAQGEKPSGSVIIRRALDLYISHIEKQMKVGEKIRMEMLSLKSHTDGNSSPWFSSPVFDGRPFNKMLNETQRQQHAEMFRREFGIELPTKPVRIRL